MLRAADCVRVFVIDDTLLAIHINRSAQLRGQFLLLRVLPGVHEALLQQRDAQPRKSFVLASCGNNVMRSRAEIAVQQRDAQSHNN